MLIRSLLLALITVVPVAPLVAAEGKPAKILLFTKSSGFEHSVIKQNKDGSPCLVEKTLVELGAKHGFTILHSKDGGWFTAEKLKEFDAFAFYTTGDLTIEGTDKQPPMSPGGKQALFDAVKAGKGFIGFHSASDTFHAASGKYSYVNDAVPDPFSQLLGAEFIQHGAQQKARAITTDATFPGIQGFKEATELQEEWYSLKQYPKYLHVLQVLDTSTMKGNMYERANYPVTWIHPYGDGKVFYTAMGHREDVWANPIYQQLIVGGFDYVLRRVKVDDSPNIDTVAPKANVLPPPPPPKAK